MITAQNNKSSLLLSLNFICKCDRTASPQIEKLHSTFLLLQNQYSFVVLPYLALFTFL